MVPLEQAARAGLTSKSRWRREGRPQVYGTQMTADQDGAPVAWPIEDEEHVEERRRAMGMPSIAEYLQAWMTDRGED